MLEDYQLSIIKECKYGKPYSLQGTVTNIPNYLTYYIYNNLKLLNAKHFHETYLQANATH